MGRIHRLSLFEAQKIAAGQVVERPVNVVKELIENACDAGATELLLELEDAGKTRIHLVDNGFGMSPEDARLSIEKHATSKIESIDDLTTIRTFGFRGEALASIAAVSHMKLTTKQASDLHATQLHIADGAIIEERICAHNTGTSVEICDLFYNMPARQKFLKKRETEWNQIHHFLQAFYLSHCAITVTTVQSKQKTLYAPAVGSLRDRCAQVWSSEVVHDLIEIEKRHYSDTLFLNGIISNHQHARYDRSGIFFFVNNRWVQNSTLIRAFLKAYHNVLPAGRYPIGCIYITIDPREIDINIHPKKEEITFLYPRLIETLIQETVSKTLESNLSGMLKPTRIPAGLLPDGSIARMQQYVPYQRSTELLQHKRDQPQNLLWHTMNDNTVLPTEQEPTYIQHISTVHTRRELQGVQLMPHYIQEEYVQSEMSIVEYTIIGQYATTYILVEHANGLWMIDQHAAHERVLYESFVKSQPTPTKVQFIVPHVITLARDQLIRLEPHLDIVRSNGFDVDLFGHDQLIISSAPIQAKHIACDELIRQCISWIAEYQSYTEQEFATMMHHHIRAQMACKAAVKAGDVLSHKEMIELLEKLEKTPNKLTCPHGRPTSWLINLHEIEKKFKRKN